MSNLSEENRILIKALLDKLKDDEPFTREDRDDIIHIWAELANMMRATIADNHHLADLLAEYKRIPKRKMQPNFTRSKA